MIDFEVFQVVSFAISGSLFLYMLIQLFTFMVSTFHTVDESENLRPARR
jgi:hypothetical protein